MGGSTYKGDQLIQGINLYTGKYGKLAAQSIEDILQTSNIKNNFA